jgi:hypothetical protein
MTEGDCGETRCERCQRAHSRGVQCQFEYAKRLDSYEEQWSEWTILSGRVHHWRTTTYFRMGGRRNGFVCRKCVVWLFAREVLPGISFSLIASAALVYYNVAFLKNNWTWVLAPILVIGIATCCYWWGRDRGDRLLIAKHREALEHDGWNSFLTRREAGKLRHC